MTQEARELPQKALALPDNERAELAGNLIASLDATVDADVVSCSGAGSGSKSKSKGAGKSARSTRVVPRL
jgi:hypothetical protein